MYKYVFDVKKEYKIRLGVSYHLGLKFVNFWYVYKVFTILSYPLIQIIIEYVPQRQYRILLHKETAHILLHYIYWYTDDINSAYI